MSEAMTGQEVLDYLKNVKDSSTDEETKFEFKEQKEKKKAKRLNKEAIPPEPKKKLIKPDSNTPTQQKTKSSITYTTPIKKFNFNSSSCKIFSHKLAAIATPFFRNYTNVGGNVSASPNCICGQECIIKGKSYVCPNATPCPFLISQQAFATMIEHDYINVKTATTSGIVLPMCEKCKGYKIVTGGNFFGDHVIVFRCNCQKNNIVAVLTKDSNNPRTIEKMCNTKFYIYDNLPSPKTGNLALDNYIYPLV